MDAVEISEQGHGSWPAQGVSRVPYWVYSDPGVFQREMERIFNGAAWNYAGLTCEVPEPGSFKTNFIGNRPVVVTRDQDGALHCFVNRCAHRGVKFCRRARGKAQDFICPYHQWTYDLQGNLVGVPFRRGVKRQGGMPKDFEREHHVGGRHHRVAVTELDAGRWVDGGGIVGQDAEAECHQQLSEI